MTMTEIMKAEINYDLSETNPQWVYTIEVTIWNPALIATSEIYQTADAYEFWKMTKQIEQNCITAMENGEIRDYRITRSSHNL